MYLAGPGEEVLSRDRVVKTEANVTGSWAIPTKVMALSALDFVVVIACAPTLTAAMWQSLWMRSDAMDSMRMDS